MIFIVSDFPVPDIIRKQENSKQRQEVFRAACPRNQSRAVGSARRGVACCVTHARVSDTHPYVVSRARLIRCAEGWCVAHARVLRWECGTRESRAALISRRGVVRYARARVLGVGVRHARVRARLSYRAEGW